MGTEDTVWGPHFVTDQERNALNKKKAELEAAQPPEKPVPEPTPPEADKNRPLGRKV